MVYAACHVPMAQPKGNVIGGHFVSALVGVLVYYFLGSQWWSVAFGVTLAIVTMMVTNTLHPPGGATAFVAVYTQQGFGFIFCPVLVGAIALVVIAVLVNNLSNKCKYRNIGFRYIFIVKPCRLAGLYHKDFILCAASSSVPSFSKEDQQLAF